MKRIAIYGCGGFGREILPLARQSLGVSDATHKDAIVFVSDVAAEVGTRENGTRVISFAELVQIDRQEIEVVVSLGAPKVRRELAERCEREGFAFRSLVASTHRSLDDVRYGTGSVFCDFSMTTSNVQIGKHFQCNIYSYVAHDCVIGDFVTFAPRVNCNGRIIVEDDVYIGTSAVLRQGSPEKPLVIGKGSVIGMGAVVTKDVMPFTTMAGNPARVLRR